MDLFCFSPNRAARSIFFLSKNSFKSGISIPLDLTISLVGFLSVWCCCCSRPNVVVVVSPGWGCLSCIMNLVILACCWVSSCSCCCFFLLFEACFFGCCCVFVLNCCCLLFMFSFVNFLASIGVSGLFVLFTLVASAVVVFVAHCVLVVVVCWSPCCFSSCFASLLGVVSSSFLNIGRIFGCFSSLSLVFCCLVVFFVVVFLLLVFTCCVCRFSALFSSILLNLAMCSLIFIFFCCCCSPSVVVVAWVPIFRAILVREVPRPPPCFILVIDASPSSALACLFSARVCLEGVVVARAASVWLILLKGVL